MARIRADRARAGKLITRAVVTWVAARVARGVPLELALATCKQPIQAESFNRALQRNPILSGLYARAKGEFLAKATSRLSKNRDWRAIAWLLERRHSDMFAPPPPPATTVNVTQMSVDPRLLEAARLIAREITSGKAGEVITPPSLGQGIEANGDPGKHNSLENGANGSEPT